MNEWREDSILPFNGLESVIHKKPKRHLVFDFMGMYNPTNVGGESPPYILLLTPNPRRSGTARQLLAGNAGPTLL